MTAQDIPESELRSVIASQAQVIDTLREALKLCNPAVIWDKARMFYQDGESDIIRQWHHRNCEIQQSALALSSPVPDKKLLGEKDADVSAEKPRPTEAPEPGDVVP